MLSIPLEQRGFVTLASLRAALVDHGQDAFCREVCAGRPALIVEAALPGSGGPAPLSPELLFHQTHEEDDADFAAIYRGAVALLRKRPGNPFPHMINLGRAPNCDVVLLLPTVSKLHAYVQPAGAGWALVDSRSRNGTFLDGVRLVPGEARELRSGARIRLGKVELDLRVVDPVELCAELRLS